MAATAQSAPSSRLGGDATRPIVRRLRTPRRRVSVRNRLPRDGYRPRTAPPERTWQPRRLATDRRSPNPTGRAFPQGTSRVGLLLVDEG